MSTAEGLLWSPAAAPPRVEAPVGDVAVAVAEILKRDRRFRRSLALADVVSAWLTVLAAALLFGAVTLGAALVVAPLAVVTAAKLLGLYDRDEVLLRKTTLDEAPGIFQVSTLIAIVLWLVGVLHAGRPEFVVICALLFTLTLALRACARAVVSRFAAEERCVFVGDSREYARLAAKLELRATNARLVSCISPQALDAYGDTPPGAGAVSLVTLLAHSGAQRVILEPSSLPSADMLELVRALKGLGLRVSLLPKVLDVVGTAVEFDELDGMTILGVRSFGISRSSWLAKRAFDLVVGTFAMLVAAPLMAIIAAAIKLDSGGPVLFRQIRIGRDDKPFEILKFRTMVADAEQRKAELAALNEADGPIFKMRNDPRLTTIGRLLRRTSLDELPQLWNVLRGEMSLVGPRPPTPDEVASYAGWHRRRLDATPGLTGLWQVLGRSDTSFDEMVRLDIYYAENWSPGMDLRIILQTIPVVLSGKGAY
jgi:exopolysaccharide biosynthesis polyprenyl glycosylphosphotransferase